MRATLGVLLEQWQKKSPGPQKIEVPCVLPPANIPRGRGCRARRWRETRRRARRVTPVGDRRARPSMKAVEIASTKAVESFNRGRKSKHECREAEASLKLEIKASCLLTTANTLRVRGRKRDCQFEQTETPPKKHRTL